MPTGEDIRESFKDSFSWLSKNRHMLEKDREQDAIEIIKCKGKHIGTPEAKVILEMTRLFLRG